MIQAHVAQHMYPEIKQGRDHARTNVVTINQLRMLPHNLKRLNLVTTRIYANQLSALKVRVVLLYKQIGSRIVTTQLQ